MARTIQFVEETLRDGQLSLWATRMTTDTMLGVAHTIEKAGFPRACVGSGAAFDTAIRFLREDPWERLRLVRREMPRVPLEFLVRGRNLIGWRRYPDDVVDLFVQSLSSVGFDWLLIFDGLNDMRNIAHHIRRAKEEGTKVAGCVIFTESPVHTDEYFVAKTRELARLGADTVCVYDASGVLTPERLRRLLPELQRAVRPDCELELNVHASTGLAVDCYIEGLKAGVDIISTASTALANGDSIPATPEMVRRARELGLEVVLDDALVARIDDYFHWIAYREKQPVSAPVAFASDDYRRYVAHQVPGGMMSNFRRQLAEAGQSQRLPEILEEIARVRAELGYPPMVTPYSQMIGVQATLNVLGGERYKTSPAELTQYVRGDYGELAAPIDPEVMDRVLSGGEPQPVDPAAVFGESMVAPLRAQNRGLSDEDLLLKIFYDPKTLEEFRRTARPTDPEMAPRTPVVALAKELLERPRVRSFTYVRNPMADGRGLAFAEATRVGRLVDEATQATHLGAELGPVRLAIELDVA